MEALNSRHRSPIRVVHICPRYAPAPGGVELFFRKVSEALAGRGDAVEVWTTDAGDVRAFTSRQGRRLARGASDAAGVVVRRFAIRHVPLRPMVMTAVHALPFGRTWACLTPRWSPLVPSLWRAARRPGIKPILVHGASLPYSSLLWAAWRLANRADARLVLSPFLHLGQPGRAGERTRRVYLSDHNRWLLRQADLVLVQTRAELDAVAGAGVDRDRLSLVGMGVDAADCTGGSGERGRARWGITPGEVVVGHLANKSADKGTVDLLDAAEMSWQRGQRFRLLLAGQEMASFAARWRKVDPGRPVVNLGELDDQERRDFYAAIDVFALPSYVESFGISLLEAAANRVPSVAYRIGGPAEVVVHEQTGLLVEPADLAGLAGAIEWLVDQPALRRSLGDSARSMAVSRSWRRSIEAVLGGYDRLIESRLEGVGR